MELDEGLPRAVPDGCVLYTLPNGIKIVRRKKHEPIDAANLSRQDLERLTGKENGAKFLPGTTLARIVEMTAQILEEKRAQVGEDGVFSRIPKKGS